MNIFKDDIILSEKQKEILNASPNSIIMGSAGTGKTLLAAKFAIKIHQTNKSICLIVYTKTLSKFIKNYFGESNIDVFHQFEWFNQKVRKSYDVIIIDEFQDFSIQSINSFRLSSKQGVYLFGDIEQKLYSKDLYDKNLTINEVEIQVLVEEGFNLYELNENYRIPRDIVEIVVKIFDEVPKSSSESISIFDRIRRAKYLKKKILTNNLVSEKTLIKQFYSKDKEIEWIVNFVKNIDNTNIGILFPTNFDIQLLSQVFTENGIINGFKDNNNNTIDFNNTKNINLMTIHSSKGLEFDCVIMPFFNDENLVHINSIDGANIIYVALTRTKKQLVVTYHSDIMWQLTKLKDISNEFEIHYKPIDELDMQKLRDLH
jgi:superfamily I DNA/RNA helicase